MPLTPPAPLQATRPTFTTHDLKTQAHSPEYVQVLVKYENGDLDCHRTRTDVEPGRLRRKGEGHANHLQTQSAVALPRDTLALRHITGRPHVLELLDAPPTNADDDEPVIFTLRLEALERPVANLDSIDRRSATKKSESYSVRCE